MIADVHGNRPALAAVLDAASIAATDLPAELGDALSGQLRPAETFNMLEATGTIALRGSHDRGVARHPSDKLGATGAFTRMWLSTTQCTALCARPVTWCGEGILAMHALTAHDLTYVLHEAARQGIRERLPLEVSAPLPDGRLVMNHGSVGLPAYANTTPHARWAMLKRQGATWRAQYHAIPYDWAAAQAASHGRQDWPQALATGTLH